LRKAGYNPLEFYNSQKAREIAEALKQKTLDDLFINIGFGRINTKQILARLLAEEKAAAPSSKEKAIKKPEGDQRDGSVVRLGDIDDIMYRIARCCSPLPGDEIVGYVTRGRGVTIHKSRCSNMKMFAKDPERLIPLFWEGNQRGHVSTNIEIVSRDRQNLLSDVSQMISLTGTNIVGCQSQTVNAIATFEFTLEVKSTNHLNTIMQQLLGVEGVKSVRRLRQKGRNQSKNSDGGKNPPKTAVKKTRKEKSNNPKRS